MVLWFTVAAVASPGSAGAVHLGALPVEADAVYAGAGAGAGWVFGGFAGVPFVEAGAAVGERGAVSAMVGTVVPAARRTVPALVSGRYLAVDQPTVRVAVTLSALVIPYFPEDESVDLEAHLSPGVAVDAGGDHVRFDAAIPIWGVSSYNQYVNVERFPVPALSSAGVSFTLGEHQRLRVGLPDGLSWHYRGEHVYVDVGGNTLLLAGVLWFKVGAMI